MKSEELIEEIKIIIEAIKADISRLHKGLPGLFKAADQLSAIDKSSASEIKARLLELNSLTDETEIISKIEEIKVILAKVKEKQKTIVLDQYSGTYLVKYYGIKGVERTGNYLKANDKYKSSLKAIKKCESDILSTKEYIKNLHEPIKYGKYAGYLHAKIDNNLRLMYFVDTNTKILWFDNIITKNELEKS